MAEVEIIIAIDTRYGNNDVHWSNLCFRAMQRYEEAAEAYEEGLKTSPGDAALGRGLDDVLKAQEASKAPAGAYNTAWHCCTHTQA